MVFFVLLRDVLFPKGSLWGFGSGKKINHKVPPSLLINQAKKMSNKYCIYLGLDIINLTTI